MFLRRSVRWPKQFGFEIAGLGPSFVTAVEKDSVAFNSGLQPGDQILELDNQDVTNMSAKAIRTLAKHSRTQPPTLGVVSRRVQTNLTGSKTMGLGLMVSDTKPVIVESVEKGGPADTAGIQKGDIVLEVNGTPVTSSDVIKPYLPASGRHVALGYIPAGKQSTKKAKSSVNHSTSEGSRVKRARNLHDKMNEILGEDYEKKLAAVSVLKQYAEDRDVGTLAKALCFILKTPSQRKLLDYIRSFIPPKEQPKFDNIVNRTQTFQSRPETRDASPSARKVGERRTFQVVRENGKFGFVIKGSNPAFVETIESNGPAEKAGVQQGDFIIKLNGIDVRKCTHSHLIDLFQDSGTAPIIEILRSDQEGYPYNSSGLGSTSTLSTSSHSDSGWTSHNNTEAVDKSGRSYSERADFLLTRKERARIKYALAEYQGTSNIIELFECVSEVLDTPSKKTLWMFIIARLPSHHQQYCINQINLPTDVLLEAVNSVSEDGRSFETKNEGEPNRNVTRIEVRDTNDSSGVQLSTFHQQVDYLLTSKERSVLKKALQLYAENRSINHLFEDLDAIFDTPSKKTLWMFIIPLMSGEHKGELRERIQNPNGALLSPYQRKTKETPPITSSEDDEHELFSKSGERKMKTKPGHGANILRGLDIALIKELEETRKAVQEAKTLFARDREIVRDNTRHVTVIPIDRRVYDGDFERVLNVQASQSNPFDVSIDNNEGSPAVVSGQQISNVSAGNRLQVPNIVNGPDTDTDGASKKHFKESKFSKMGGGTFNRHALTALKQLDEAVAAEVKGIELHNAPSEAVNGVQTVEPSLCVPPPPVPPPPVAPPPPPPPLVKEMNKTNKTKMNVKRINWEKIDQQKVGNTIWEQLGDNSDLQDVVRYLELEQQFSTKSSGQKRLTDRRHEILILNPKKAYTISILLGHLKLDDREVKHALYQMDETILTPELVRQLLAYAPNKDEVGYFDSYNGDVEELSRPDRFTYEMSRVPGYEQRLRAIVFKENFQEKIGEMKEQLQHIRKASIELRQSKNLSRLLELILAMGNYLNEGNERIGKAAGFKIKFLSQLEVTKTADNKATFLHILAETVYDKFPEILAVGEELTAVSEAAKVSNVSLNQELQDLRKVLQDISDTLEKFGAQKTSLGIADRFQDVMGFIAHASDEIQSLFRLNASTMEEFHSTVQYFGEDTKKITTTDLFGVFADFITKFEKSHRENMMYKRHPKKENVTAEILV